METFEDFIDFVNHNKNEFVIPKEFMIRGGDGIGGQSLESILSLGENNRQDSDFENFELKTSKDGSTARCTLFNKGTRRGSNSNWSVDKYHFQEKFGTGYVDVSSNENKYGIKLVVENDIIKMIDNENTYYSISVDDVVKKASSKLKNMLFVDLNVKDKITITKAKFFSNISSKSFIQAIKDGKIVICSNVGSSGHDRGTQFRIGKHLIKDLFETIEEYEWEAS